VPEVLERFIFRISTVWPRCRSGAVGSKPTLTTSGSGTVPHELIADAVRNLMSRAPDLIILGGDYITSHDTRYAGPAAAALEGLAAPHGVFAVLGNHDDERAVPAALKAAGFEVLRDARTTLRMRGETVDLAGLRYWDRSREKIARVLAGASRPCIVAAHDPRRLEEVAVHRVSLLLSGHTHGGQIVLPWVGAVAARAFPVVAGHATRRETTIYVSRGVGTVYVPVRLNCPPEVTVLTAQPEDSGARSARVP
jgi:uncharacterized protein